MKKHFTITVIGLALVLLGLAACAQVVYPAGNSPTPVPIAEIIPTNSPDNPSGNGVSEAVAPSPAFTVPAAPAASPTIPPTAAPTAVPTVVNHIPLPAEVSGIIQDAKGPIAGAIVQVQGKPPQVKSEKNGAYRIGGLSGTTPAIVTAWSEGYYVGWVAVNPSAPEWKGSDRVNITLKPVPPDDNIKYPWFSFGGAHGSASCALCHRENKEWEADAHSNAAKNNRFTSVYSGTNAQGQESQPVIWGSNAKPLPIDPTKPDYGPGFRLDYPNRAGNCATCHTPVASQVANTSNCGWSGCHTTITTENSRGIIAPSTSAIALSGDGAEGITCEFCHKVGQVTIDPKTGLPPPDMPGILSMRLYRPQDGQQIFFGTLVDVNRRVSYSPLETKSEFCAPCHYGVFGGVMGVGQITGGTVIYNSYGEWLNSPYSDPKTGMTCQQCHMPVKPVNYFVFPETGGLTRDYQALHNHTMPGVTDEQFMKNAVSMKSSAQRVNGQLNVKVSITNTNTGHDIPTDAPIRQMILVVEATDTSGKPLDLKTGPVNPDWAGNFAGLPGKTFMKVLRDEWTGEAPTTAYWRPITVVEDTRLAALATDVQQFTFLLPAGSDAAASAEVIVHVRLIFRRSYQKLAQQKGWNDPDILMQEATITITK